METIGEYLKRIREERGLSVQQVSVKTRISPVFIEALEENRLDQFPGEVFARGFVQSYGRCLGLDDPDTMGRFNQSARSFFRERDEKKRTTELSAEQEKVRHEFRGRAIRGVIVAVLGLTIVAVYVINSRNSKIAKQTPAPISSPEAVPPSESQSGPPELALPAVNKPVYNEAASAKPGTATPPSAPPAVPPKPPQPKPLPAAAAPREIPSLKPEEKLPLIVNVPGTTPEIPGPAQGLVLVIEAVEASWVSAKIDGGETKEVFLDPGEKITWKATDQFLVSLGNAGGVKVQFNGKSLPPFGPKGAVVKDVKISRE